MPAPTMIFDDTGIVLFSVSILVILTNITMLVITKRTSVGRFLPNLQAIYAVNLCWQVTSTVRYFAPFDSDFALQVFITVHVCFGASITLLNVNFNVKVLEAFSVLTHLSPTFTVFLKVLAAILNVIAVALHLLIKYADIKSLVSVSPIIMIICAGYTMLINNGKTVHVLRLVYKDRLRVSKKNQQMKDDISRKYLRLNVTFVIIFVLEIVGMVIWGLGLTTLNQKMIKSSELFSNLSLWLYPSLIVGIRDLRFDKRSVKTAEKSAHQANEANAAIPPIESCPTQPIKTTIATN